MPYIGLLLRRPFQPQTPSHTHNLMFQQCVACQDEHLHIHYIYNSNIKEWWTDDGPPRAPNAIKCVSYDVVVGMGPLDVAWWLGDWEDMSLPGLPVVW